MHYFFCQKCSSLQMDQYGTSEEHDPHFHQHRNTWWPLMFVDEATAARLIMAKRAVMREGEPIYNVEEMLFMRSAGSTVAEKAPVAVPAAVPAAAAEPPLCDWDAELIQLLKEGA